MELHLASKRRFNERLRPTGDFPDGVVYRHAVFP